MTAATLPASACTGSTGGGDGRSGANDGSSSASGRHDAIPSRHSMCGRLRSRPAAAQPGQIHRSLTLPAVGVPPLRILHESVPVALIRYLLTGVQALRTASATARACRRAAASPRRAPRWPLPGTHSRASLHRRPPSSLRPRPRVPRNQRAASLGTDVDAALQHRIAQDIVAVGLRVDAVAAAGVARVAQRPGPLLPARLRIVLELVQIFQPVHAIHVHRAGVTHAEIVVQRLGDADRVLPVFSVISCWVSWRPTRTIMRRRRSRRCRTGGARVSSMLPSSRRRACCSSQGRCARTRARARRCPGPDGRSTASRPGCLRGSAWAVRRAGETATSGPAGPWARRKAVGLQRR